MKIDYTIWMVPKEPLFSKSASVINQLSQDYGTLKFEPHVTILPEILGDEKKIGDKVASIASSIKPFTVKLGEGGYGDSIFHCLFIKVQQRTGHYVRWCCRVYQIQKPEGK